MTGISNTDWDKCTDKNRDYVNYFVRKVLIDYNKNFNDFMFQKEIKVQSVWFQQYYNGDYHNWHVHDETQFTNIYFLELPENKLKTEIFDNFSKKIINLDVEEGDILTLPSYIIHRSKINTTNKRKTIISFNTVFGEIDSKKIERTLTN